MLQHKRKLATMQLDLGRKVVLALFSLLLVLPMAAVAIGGNTYNESFNRAKTDLEHKVYSRIPKNTIYCDAVFEGKKIVDPNGFSSTRYENRAHKLEWEHIVPAENFGRTFPEWRDGHELCTKANGESFRGRNCASKANKTFRYMLADMYNLAPSIGAVNAMRSNYNFAQGLNSGQSLGQCSMKIDTSRRKAEPPPEAKGFVARAYLYMDKTYSSYRTSQRKLFKSWDKQYPVTETECKRAKKIELIQHNTNRFVKTPCIRAGMWL